MRKKVIEIDNEELDLADIAGFRVGIDNDKVLKYNRIKELVPMLADDIKIKLTELFKLGLLRMEDEDNDLMRTYGYLHKECDYFDGYWLLINRIIELKDN